MSTLSTQIFAALDAANHENAYPHEYDRVPVEIALEIHDWRGLHGFDHDCPVAKSEAATTATIVALSQPAPR
ncbi:MAG: hypothetical protein AAFP13_14985 [Pseudomonadota bacterium]